MKAIRIAFLTVALGWLSMMIISLAILVVSQMFAIPFLKDLTYWNFVGLSFIKVILVDNKVTVGVSDNESLNDEAKTIFVIVTSFIIRSGLIGFIILMAFLAQKFYLN